MAKPKPKLTPVAVKIRLKSGRMTTGTRYKNLIPAANAFTPAAGPAPSPALSTPRTPKLNVVEPDWFDDTNLDHDDAGPLYDHGFSLNLESGAIREWDRHRSENGRSPEEYYGHVFAVTFPGPLSAKSKAHLFEEIRADLENRMATHSSVWDGQNFVNGAVTNEDADSALESTLAGYEDDSLDLLIKLGEERNEELRDDLERIAESLTTDATSVEAVLGDQLDAYLTLKDRRTGVEAKVFLEWGEDFDTRTNAGVAELAEFVAEHDAEDDEDD